MTEGDLGRRGSATHTAEQRQETHGVEDNPGYPSGAGGEESGEGYSEVWGDVFIGCVLSLLSSLSQHFLRGHTHLRFSFVWVSIFHFCSFCDFPPHHRPFRASTQILPPRFRPRLTPLLTPRFA
jgi:hypothetical protein